MVLLGFSCLLRQAGFAQCYVTTLPPVSASGCNIGDAIDSFSLNGVPTTGNYDCSGPSAYTLFTAPVRNLVAGNTYSFTATTGTSGSYTYNQHFAIWIDLNNNNVYDSTEMLYSSNTSKTSHSGFITIPYFAATGNNIRMRTRCSYVSKLLPNQACMQVAYGETEDYLVNITQPCSGPPVLTYQSGDTSMVCGFGNARFSVDAQGPNVQYQWQLRTGANWFNVTNNGTYSGANTKNLDINGYNPDFDGNKYRCVVNNNCGAIASNTMELLIDASPVTVEPPGAIACEGNQVILPFAVSNAGGTVHTYQWYVKTPSHNVMALNAGPLYTGVDTPLLVMSSVTPNMDGNEYFCIIDNGCWSTDTVLLNVKKLPVISDQPRNDTACMYESASFTVLAQGSNLHYQWQIFNSTGWQNLANSSIYSNVNTQTLVVQNPDMSNHGKSYRCEVAGDCDTIYSDPALLTVYDGFSIIAQPQDSTACVNSVATFRVATMSTSPVTYQWMMITSTGLHVPVDTPLYLYGNSAEMVVLSAEQKLHATKYYCVISNRCMADTTIMATLYVNPCGGDNHETGIKTAEQDVISVYPNPTNGGKINVAALYHSRTAEVRIVNRMGVVVHSAAYDIPNNNIITLDIDKLPQGVYSIQILEHEQHTPRIIRFVKE